MITERLDELDYRQRAGTRVALATLVSVAFMWSGLLKLWNPIGFAAAVAGYRLTGPRGTLLVAALLPAIEITCAIGIWVSRWRRAAIWVLSGACVVFLAALGQAWMRGLDIGCGCFGDHGGTAQYPYWIARDLVFLAALVWAGRCGSICPFGTANRVNSVFRVREAATLLVVAALVGLGLDAVHPRGVFWREVSERALERHRAVAAGPPETPGMLPAPAEPSEVTLEQLRALVDSGAALIVDARPRVFWRIGHIPGAISVPHDDFDRGLAALQPHLASESNKQVVVYCEGGDCHDGITVASRLRALGINEVQLFRGGWEAWESARPPVQVER